MVRETDTKNRTEYFFDDIISIKNFDPNNIKRDKKKCLKNIFIFWIGSMPPNSLKPFLLITNNESRYIEQSNGNKHLTLFPTEETEDNWKSMRNTDRD